MRNQIKAYFTESIQTQIVAAESLPESITQAASILVQILLEGGKILCCGNGASASNAQSFVAKLIHRFEVERPGLPAIALTADHVVFTAVADDGAADEVYAKQVNAIANTGDVLIAISPLGKSQNVIKAVEAAVRRDMAIIALTGADGGELAGLLGSHDVEIKAPSYRVTHIEEMHTLVLNCLCSLIEQALFPQLQQEELG